MQIDAIVVFGATGDLARKMLFPALYRLEERGELDQRIVGVALDEWDLERFRRHVADAVGDAISGADLPVLERLVGRLGYVAGDYTGDRVFVGVREALGPGVRCLYYLAIPPSMFGTVVSGLQGVGLTDGARILVEKPLGRDLAGARRLNRILLSTIPEESIYRIDHFLGKEPIENLLAFRYANPVFEAVWNRSHIDHVQITMAEAFGVDGRGALYDSIGVVRDVVQNHLLQVVSLLAMDAPATPGAAAFDEARTRLLRAIPPIGAADVVFGQYRGYREAPHVAAGSTVATFAAVRLAIESPAWSGVPFFVRTGKELPVTATEATVVFRQRPPLPFSSESLPPTANRLVFQIGPSDGACLVVSTKKPGDGVRLSTARLSVDFERAFGRIPLAYERVISDALRGDRSIFAGERSVEEAWRIVAAIVDPPDRPHVYEPGTWGPEEAAHLLGPTRAWADPDPTRQP
jgi:glucose-6-phosphate 1-dehydrogenase